MIRRVAQLAQRKVPSAVNTRTTLCSAINQYNASSGSTAAQQQFTFNSRFAHTFAGEKELAKAIQEEEQATREREALQKLMNESDVEQLSKEEQELKNLVPDNMWATFKNSFVKVTPTNFEDVILKSQGPLIFAPYSNSSSPCLLMRPDLRQAVIDKAGKLKLADMDVEESGNAMFLAHFYLKREHPELDVYALPTLFAIRDGKVVKKTAGYMNKDEINKFVNDTFGAL